MHIEINDLINLERESESKRERRREERREGQEFQVMSDFLHK